MITRSPDRPRAIGVALFLMLVSIGLYANSFRGEFIYDDRPIVQENPLIRTLPRALRLFTTSYWGSDIHRPKALQGSLYRPLTEFTYAVNYYFSGLHARAYHITNILLNAVVVTAVFLLALTLGYSVLAAAISALFFLVLPVHVEAVSSIVGRAEVLAALFLLFAWIFLYQEERVGVIAAGFLCFILAMFSKETGMTFPAALILSELALSDDWRQTVRQRAPLWVSLVVILGLFLEWRHVVLGKALSTGSSVYFTGRLEPVVALTMAKFFFLKYLWPLFTGFHLCADYSRPTFPDALRADPLAWACLAGLILLGLFALYGTVRRRFNAWALLLFLILLLPVSNLFLRIEVIGAERFLYWPSAALCLWLGRECKKPMIAILAAYLIFLACRTAARSQIWETSERFWSATLKDAPMNPHAWNGAGLVDLDAKRYDDAQLKFERALALEPMLMDAQYNLADVAFLKGNLADAEKGFLTGLDHVPWEKDSLFHLALIAEDEKNLKKAAWYYQDVLKVDPYDADAHRNLGLIFCRVGQIAACREHLATYLELAPAGESTDDVRHFLSTLPIAS